MGGITKIWESNCSVSFVCVSVNGVEWGHRQSSGVRFCFLLTKQNPKPEHREHRAQCQTGSCGLNNALYLNVTLKTSVWTFLVFVTDNRRTQHIPVGRQCVLSLFCRGYFNKIPSKASEMAQWYRQPAAAMTHVWSQRLTCWKALSSDLHAHAVACMNMCVHPHSH